MRVDRVTVVFVPGQKQAALCAEAAEVCKIVSKLLHIKPKETPWNDIHLLASIAFNNHNPAAPMASHMLDEGGETASR